MRRYDKVVARKGNCIGLTITDSEYAGEIIKINKKSIIVEMKRALIKENGKTMYDCALSAVVRFPIWKMIGKSDLLFRDSVYGVIQISSDGVGIRMTARGYELYSWEE